MQNLRLKVKYTRNVQDLDLELDLDVLVNLGLDLESKLVLTNSRSRSISLPSSKTIHIEKNVFFLSHFEDFPIHGFTLNC